MNWTLIFYFLAIICSVVSLASNDVELLATALLMTIMGILTERTQ